MPALAPELAERDVQNDAGERHDQAEGSAMAALTVATLNGERPWTAQAAASSCRGLGAIIGPVYISPMKVLSATTTGR